MRSSTASSVVNEECTWAQSTNTVCEQPAVATEATVATLAYMHQLRDDEQEADKVHHEHESPSNVVITQQGVQELNTFADRDALSTKVGESVLATASATYTISNLAHLALHKRHIVLVVQHLGLHKLE